ncbi:ABC transporter ATP-binding protein [Mesorhizobium sp. B2-6-5]|uniref:ABC transporter ATP-binding protein n=1 Tax=Mesorhizobium sp. B2-6-5 TaxID=2589912 RepID=UPI0015E45BF1|nr:ABC transporter ATP-binding protein [Mesorhizobium sp. B2-6-5]
MVWEKMSVNVHLHNLRKRYGRQVALDGVSLDLVPGEITSLLGPSGCGKTTTLRLIAGFETADDGEIYFDRKQINKRPPEKREVGMVFQNYCLFPHMTVQENIAFGLQMRRQGSAEIREKTERILDMVQLAGYEERRPSELSGGQQQRVALARALVIDPAVLLLDEPLGALDKGLRESMQFELKRIQRRLGPTTIIVTHDQEEALTLSGRVAVMKNGKVVQSGAPKDIYDRPRTRFVAEFLGGANLFSGIVTGRKSDAFGCVASRRETFVFPWPEMSSIQVGSSVTCAVRPEHIHFGKPGEGDNSLSVKIADSIFRGTSRTYEAWPDGYDAPLQVISSSDRNQVTDMSYDKPINIYWNPENMMVLEEE